MDWMGLLFIIGLCLAVFMVFAIIRRNPESFKANNMMKSLNTLGVLALILIAVIVLCILLLRH